MGSRRILSDPAESCRIQRNPIGSSRILSDSAESYRIQPNPVGSSRILSDSAESNPSVHVCMYAWRFQSTPPSQISKKWIKRQILNVFLRNLTSSSGARFSLNMHTRSVNIHTCLASIHTFLACIHTCLQSMHTCLAYIHTCLTYIHKREAGQFVRKMIFAIPLPPWRHSAAATLKIWSGRNLL